MQSFSTQDCNHHRPSAIIARAQGPFHAAIDAFDHSFVLRRMCEVLAGNPTDDAACGGCKALEWLVKYNKYARLPTLRPADLHDVIIPVWLHKEVAALTRMEPNEPQ